MPRNKRPVEEEEEDAQDIQQPQGANAIDSGDEKHHHAGQGDVDASDDDDDDDGDGEEVEEDEDDEESESSVDEKEIQVEFEAYPTQESDFYGVRKLLQQLFLKANIDLSSLTEEIISQSDTSFVIQQADGPEDEDEDEIDTEVYGISSMINLSSSNAKCIQQLRNFLLSKINNVQNVEKLEDILKNPSKNATAWIVNERFINLSPQIALPCLQNLYSQVESQPEKYTFEYFIFIVKLLRSTGKMSKRKLKKLKKSSGSSNNSAGESSEMQEVIYQNPEEEILADAADESLEWNVSEQCDSDARGGNWDEEDVKYTPWRKILMLSRKSFQSALNALKQELHSLPTASASSSST